MLYLLWLQYALSAPPLPPRHVTPYQARIILTDCRRGIIQSRKDIGPDVPYLCGVVIQAVHNIPDVLAVQAEEPALHRLYRHILLVNADGFSGASAYLRYQFHEPVNALAVIGIIMDKDVVGDIFLYLLAPVLHFVHLICPGCFVCSVCLIYPIHLIRPVSVICPAPKIRSPIRTSLPLSSRLLLIDRWIDIIPVSITHISIISLRFWQILFCGFHIS